MMSTRVDDRARAAGAVGGYLKRLLFPNVINDFVDLRFSDQISYVFRSTWFGLRPTQLRRAAHSFMLADVPVQVPLPSSELWSLVDHSCPVPELELKADYKWRWVKDAATTTKRFPNKANPAALNKVNLFLNEVGSDMARVSLISLQIGLQYLDWVRARTVVYNDQATAFLLYGYCLSRHHTYGWRHAAAAIYDSGYSKGFSDFGKAVGANGTLVGAMLVESNTLLGRAVAPADLEAQARERSTNAGVNKLVARYDDSTIRAAVRGVLLAELKRKGDSYLIEYPSLADHWASRWRWAVNGAHSGLIYKRHPEYRPYLPGFDRVHRRAWLETISDDPRPEWEGRTYVSVSPKLEHGKTRAIFACDTVNYLAFEHLMSEVERNWRGERVVLNPGKGGHIGMAERVQKARSRSGVSLMLDYDDFNSHHSTRAMQIIVEELCNITGYPTTLRDKLVASFDQHFVFVAGSLIGRAKGTLMSGHRMTTFINSVLNKAYLDIALGADFMGRCTTLHVGDDVYMGVRSYKEADYVLKCISASPLRMNPSKQSVGHVTTEFLRVASESRYSFGYLARSIASITSGNWTNELSLAPLEALTNIVGSARSFANRSGLADVALLLVSSTRRMTGLGSRDDTLIRDLLTGRVALQNGPNYQSSGRYRQVTIKPELIKRDEHGYGVLPLEATHAYLSSAATELEVAGLTKAGISVEEDMARASWHKSAPRDLFSRERLVVSPVTSKPCVGVAWAEMVLREKKPVGLLTQYPLLLLARYRLPEHVVRFCLSEAGGDYNTPYLEYDAWGEYAHGCVIDTVMSYTDASSLGARTAASVLTSVTRMYV